MGLSGSILEYVWQILWLDYVATIVPYFARLAAILVVLRIVEGRFVVKIQLKPPHHCFFMKRLV
jgi:hypothetical protein